jgi:hypothetical protein
LRLDRISFAHLLFCGLQKFSGRDRRRLHPGLWLTRAGLTHLSFSGLQKFRGEGEPGTFGP